MSTYIHYSRGFVTDNVQTLLDTMTEISSILYSRPEKCCQKSILRLHNQTFLHDIVCEEVIGRLQVLSEKKFYGRYFHSLAVHAPIQHRIVCLRSTNTEQQERHFNGVSSWFSPLWWRHLVVVYHGRCWIPRWSWWKGKPGWRPTTSSLLHSYTQVWREILKRLMEGVHNQWDSHPSPCSENLWQWRQSAIHKIYRVSRRWWFHRSWD